MSSSDGPIYRPIDDSRGTRTADISANSNYVMCANTCIAHIIMHTRIALLRVYKIFRVGGVSALRKYRVQHVKDEPYHHDKSMLNILPCTPGESLLL